MTPHIRTFSSDQVISALLRGGFEIAHHKGDHVTLKRKRRDGGHDVTVITSG